MHAPERHWLSRGRLRLYCGLLLLIFVGFEWGVAASNWKNNGEPGGLDFVTFWAASRLTLDGTPLDAYSWDAIIRTAHRISPLVQRPGGWFYPPNFLLVVKPFALLPYPVAYAIFACTTALAFVLLLRKVLPSREALLPILAFPGLWLNLAQGQNACLTASLALGALLLLEKRPVLAGACIGMLSIKPHLAILFPVALACAGMWTAFVAAGVTTVLFTGLSVAVFGTAIVPVFLHTLGAANGYVADARLPLAQMASLFAALRAVHVPITAAYVAHYCAAIAATAAVIWVWRRSQALEVRAMALVAGTFMLSLYIYNYDAAWLAIPVALFTARALQHGWLRWEREALVIAWLYPVLGDIGGYGAHVGIGPLVFSLLLFVAVRRAHLQPGAVAAGLPAGPLVRCAWFRRAGIR